MTDQSTFRLAVLGVIAVVSACTRPAPRDADLGTCTQASVSALATNTIEQFAPLDMEPGITAAVFVPSRWSSVVSVARGWSEYETQTPMGPDDIMLAGSVGKTFFAAAAMLLVDEGKLDLDAPVSRYLPALALPNAERVTVRMLMSHTSGYGEYDGVFMEALINEPGRPRTLVDWLGPLQRNPPSPPGTHCYSDLNYVVLAAIIDEVAGMSAYDYINRRFLVPYGLAHTRPSNRRHTPGLVAGYAGTSNFFGLDRMLTNDTLYCDPQFEWGGGGFASNAPDLAKWIVLLAAGDAMSRARWAEASRPVHVDSLTRNGYGLGIHVDRTALGVAYGHSGYIPGYLSWVRWYEDAGVAVAMQTNASDESRVTFDGYNVLDSIAVRVRRVCGQ